MRGQFVQGVCLMFSKKITTTVAALAIAVGAASSVRAASVTFTNTNAASSGTGNGVVLGILSLQQKGNDTTEGGFTGWNPLGTGGDAGAGTTDAQTQYTLGHTFASSTYSGSQK